MTQSGEITKLENWIIWNCMWLCQSDHDTVRGDHYTGKLDYLELLVAVSGCQSDHGTVREITVGGCLWMSTVGGCLLMSVRS